MKFLISATKKNYFILIKKTNKKKNQKPTSN